MSIKYKTKTRTKTSTNVTVAASLMLAVSTTAMFFNLGMMVVAVGNFRIASSAIIVPKFICQDYLSKPFGSKKLQNEAAGEINVQADKITREILKSLKKQKTILGKEKDNELKKIYETVYTRKKLLIDLAQENPEQAMTLILFKKQRENLGAITSNCVEKKETLEGTLEVLHADSFKEGYSVNKYTLISSNNERITLHPARELHEGLLSGMKVKVSGMRLGKHDFLFDGSRTLEKPNRDFGGLTVTQNVTNPPVLGGQNVLILLINFRNTSWPNPDVFLIRNMMEEVNVHLKESSFNQAWINRRDVFGYYNVNWDRTCNPIGMEADAIKIAAENNKNPEIPFADYSRLIIVAPYGQQCYWDGLATFDRTKIKTPDSDVYMSVSYIDTNVNTYTVYAHELGHNFGNGHDNFLNCGKVSINNFYSCERREYDSYSIMGDFQGSYNVIHRQNTGWLQESNMQTINQGGQYALTPIEINNLNLKAVRIPHSENDYLWFEYRQPIGTDVSLMPFNNAFYALMYLDRNIASYIIDPTPQGETNPSIRGRITPALMLGDKFIDPYTQSSIEAIFQKPSVFILDVKQGKTDFIPPEVAVSSPVDGAEVSGTISATINATDASGIEKAELYAITPPCQAPGLFMEPIRLVGLSEHLPYEMSIDTTKLPNGNNRLYAKAYDASGILFEISGNTSKSDYIGVEVQNIDNSIPQVKITSPLQNETVNRPYDINIDASDEVGIAKIELNIKEVNTGFDYYNYICSQPYNVKVKFANPGAYEVFARAYDYVGNYTDSDIVSFIVSSEPMSIDPTIVTIIKPEEGEELKSEFLSLVAAVNSEIGIETVEFYKDEDIVPIAIATRRGNYYASWDAKNETEGIHILRAKAIDIAGNETFSQPVSIYIDNTHPVINSISLRDGEIVSGKIQITVDASDNKTMGNVIFSFNKGAGDEYMASFTQPPYTFLWDTFTKPNGEYRLRVAAGDLAGNYTELADELKIIVNNVGVPLLDIRLLYSADEINLGLVNITADISDDLNAEIVLFYKDDDIGSFAYDKTAPFTTSINLDDWGDGVHKIKAVAYNSLGQKSESDIRSIIIVDGQLNIPQFFRGDANNDSKLDITDPIVILGNLFLGDPTKLKCQDAADVNDSGVIDITDAIHALNFLYLPSPADGTDKISAPYPDQGPDPTADDLSCEAAQ